MPVYTIETPNGKQLDIEADTPEAAQSGAEQWYAQNVTNKTNTSVTGALSQGASDLVSGVGKTVKEYISPDAGKSIQAAGANIADPKYKSATEGFSNPEDGADKHLIGRDWSKLPRALVEQAPQMAGPLIASLALRKFGPLASAIGGTSVFGLQSAGNEAQKSATARTGDINAEPDATDKLKGAGSTAAQAALNQIGLSKIINPSRIAATGASGALQAGGNVAKAAAAEGVTNAAQDAVSQAVAKTGTNEKFDPNSVVDSGIFGVAGGATFAAPRGAKDAATAVRFRDADHGADTALAANRINSKVESSADLEKPETAFKAVTSAIADVRNELSNSAREIRNASPEASNAIKRAQAGEALDKNDLAAIDAEGNATVSSLARQATALKKLTDKGSYDPSSERFAGGVGEVVRKLASNHKLTAIGATALPHIASNGFSGMDTLMSAVPGMMEAGAAGYGAYKGLKTVEKAFGIQSPARSFAEKFSNGDEVRPTVQRNDSPTGPKIAPLTNPLGPPGPWGEEAPKPQRFKPDILEPGLQKIVDKIQKDKRNEVSKDLAWTLRKFSRQQAQEEANAQPPLDVSALNEQVKGALLMHSARRKLAGQQQAEAEAAQSNVIAENGGFDALSNPAFGKRAKELLSAADAMRRLRHTPDEDSTDAPTAPVDPTQPIPDSPAGNSGTEQAGLPESPYWHLEPAEAADAILRDAISGGKEIRNREGFRAGTKRRLEGEQDIFYAIGKDLPTLDMKDAFRPYLARLWGADSPEMVKLVKSQMLSEFPDYRASIEKHLSDEKIKALWTKPKKK